MVTAKTVVEESRSGRAACHKCGDFIDKNTLRIGHQKPTGLGFTTHWEHLKCWKVPRSIEVPSEINGFLSLKDHDKRILTHYVGNDEHRIGSGAKAKKKETEKAKEPSRYTRKRRKAAKLAEEVEEEMIRKKRGAKRKREEVVETSSMRKRGRPKKTDSMDGEEPPKKKRSKVYEMPSK